MVTERVRTLPTEPTEGEIAKSNPLVSFINISQRGRKHVKTLDKEDGFNQDRILTLLSFLFIKTPTTIFRRHEKSK